MHKNHLQSSKESQARIIPISIQIRPVKTKSNNIDKVGMIPEKSLVFFSGKPDAFLKPDNARTRIIGIGINQQKFSYN